MGRYIGPKCKLCRRTGEKLFLRGERCFGPKCSIIKRNYPPGVHGPSGLPRLTSYGLQLKEKQRAKRIYNISETQIKNYYLKAKKFKGDTAYVFLRFLELRLENIVYRLGFAKSRNQARQIILHRHVLVNGKSNNKPSTQVRVGTIIALKPKSRAMPFSKSIEADLQKHETPIWLKLDTKEFSGQVIGLPTVEDLKANFDPKAIIEFYSR